MKATKICGECGVPLGISATLNWNSDGSITQRKDPSHRMIFFESDNLDRLWRRLSESVGVTLEHVWDIVIDSKSGATRAFLFRTLPWYSRALSRLVGYRTMISTIEAQGLVMGYGKITLGAQFPERGRPERITVFVEDPYSFPLFCGDFKGAAEVLERRLADVTFQALDSRRYQVDVTVVDRQCAPEPGKLPVPQPGPGPGPVAYKRCPECGAPRDLQNFSWDLKTGIIRDNRSGRRMAFFGTSSLLAVFDELVHELGGRVVESIIDIERENTVAAMTPEEACSGYQGLRYLAALRGLGLLTDFEQTDEGLSLVSASPSVPPYLVGLASGVFQILTGRPGRADWSIEADGDLKVQIRA